MSWLYIPPEQGAIIDSICEEFYTGFKPDDCKGCPLAPVCKGNDEALPADEPERTRAFEEGIWKLAEEATK